MEKQWKQWLTLFFWTSKSLWMVIAAMKLKGTFSLKEGYDQPRRHIKKQRHYFANKDTSSQGYGFSSGRVWMWELASRFLHPWDFPGKSTGVGRQYGETFVSTKVLFGQFASSFWCLYVIEDHLWSLSVIWAFLPVGSDVRLTSRTICIGKMFGAAYGSSLPRICDSSVFWYVNVYSICVIGIFVVFWQMGNSGSMH